MVSLDAKLLTHVILLVGVPVVLWRLPRVSMFLPLVIVQIALAGGRFMRREVLPVLAKCLRPLQPTPGELQAVMAELKTLRHKMATKLTLPELVAQIAGPRGDR